MDRDIGSAVWGQATAAAFLREGGGGGGLLILVPQLAGDLELFEKLGAAITAAARREINAALMVQACHPQAGVAARALAGSHFREKKSGTNSR